MVTEPSLDERSQLSIAGAAISEEWITFVMRELKRFPEDETLAGLIEQAKAAPAPDSAELEMLKSLGYIE